MFAYKWGRKQEHICSVWPSFWLSVHQGSKSSFLLSYFYKVDFFVYSHNSLSPSSPLCFKVFGRSTTPNFHYVICALGVLSLNFSTLMKSSEYKDKRTENIWQSVQRDFADLFGSWLSRTGPYRRIGLKISTGTADKIYLTDLTAD